MIFAVFCEICSIDSFVHSFSGSGDHSIDIIDHRSYYIYKAPAIYLLCPHPESILSIFLACHGLIYISGDSDATGCDCLFTVVMTNGGLQMQLTHPGYVNTNNFGTCLQRRYFPWPKRRSPFVFCIPRLIMCQDNPDSRCLPQCPNAKNVLLCQCLVRVRT